MFFWLFKGIRGSNYEKEKARGRQNETPGRNNLRRYLGVDGCSANANWRS
ncbi:hypothetical protein [Ruegeria arenilitoris]|nr:hypothetical protein [Ruegeria arenilitoris]